MLKSVINGTCAGLIFLLLIFLLRIIFPGFVPGMSYVDIVGVIPGVVVVYLISLQIEQKRKKSQNSNEGVIVTKKELITYVLGFIAVMIPSVLVLLGVDTLWSWMTMISVLIIFLLFGNDSEHNEY